MNLHPWDDVIANVQEKIKEGWDCHQQWNCAHCGTKQTMPDVNKFYMLGICEECGRETNIRQDGMNFMATMGVPSVPTKV